MTKNKRPPQEILFSNGSMEKAMRVLKIEIIGTEDPLQKMMVLNVKEALNLLGFELGRDAVISLVTDWQEIIDYNIIQTPVLVIRKQVLSQGFIPSVEGLQKIIKAFIPDEHVNKNYTLNH